MRACELQFGIFCLVRVFLIGQEVTGASNGAEGQSGETEILGMVIDWSLKGEPGGDVRVNGSGTI